MTQANAIVVLFAGALGDFVLALPALRLLRRRHDGARYVLAVRTPLVGLAEQVHCADHVAVLDDRVMAACLGGGSVPSWWPGRPRLYSWFGADDPAVRARLGAAAVVTEFLRVERGEGPTHAACAHVEALGERLSWTELGALGRITVPVTPSSASPARRLVFHRGAGAPAKRWHEAGFAEVAAWWRRAGGEAVELLGPAEERMEPLPGVVGVREPPLVDMVRLLAGAGAYVGNDSGPSHCAGVLGLPGVVLFGPTDPARWRPLSAELTVVRASPAAWTPDGFAVPSASAVIDRLRRALP